MYRKLIKLFAGVVVVFALILLIFESMTNILSRILCHEFCQDQYIASLEPKIMDLSCTFNTDMYLNFTLILLFVFGIIVNVLSAQELVDERC